MRSAPHNLLNCHLLGLTCTLYLISFRLLRYYVPRNDVNGTKPLSHSLTQPINLLAHVKRLRLLLRRKLNRFRFGAQLHKMQSILLASDRSKKEAPRFELGIRALQAPALPLGHASLII